MHKNLVLRFFRLIMRNEEKNVRFDCSVSLYFHCLKKIDLKFMNSEMSLTLQRVFVVGIFYPS